MMRYEVYGNPETQIGTFLVRADADPQQKALGINPGDTLLRTYEVESYCAAAIRHHQDNGWGWYVPMLPQDLQEWYAAMRRLGYDPAIVLRGRAAQGLPAVPGLPE